MKLKKKSSAKIHFRNEGKTDIFRWKKTKRTDLPAKPHYKNGSVVPLAWKEIIQDGNSKHEKQECG